MALVLLVTGTHVGGIPCFAAQLEAHLAGPQPPNPTGLSCCVKFAAYRRAVHVV